MPKRPGRSVRYIPEVGLILGLFGDYNYEPTLVQVSAADGEIVLRLEIPRLHDQIFEIADGGMLDAKTVFVIFRRTKSGFAIGQWNARGGYPTKWFPVAPDKSFSKHDAAGVQSHSEDRLLLVRDGYDKKAPLYSYSVALLWHEKTDRLLPPPPLTNKDGKWIKLNDAAHRQVSNGIRLGRRCSECAHPHNAPA